MTLLSNLARPLSPPSRSHVWSLAPLPRVVFIPSLPYVYFTPCVDIVNHNNFNPGLSLSLSHYMTEYTSYIDTLIMQQCSNRTSLSFYGLF